MTIPCSQEGALLNLSQAVVRMEAGQERQLVLLEKVADQGARVEHLEERVSDLHTDLNSVYSRVREVELTLKSSSPSIGESLNKSLESLSTKLDRITRFIGVITSKYALWVYGSLIFLIMSGTVLDVVYHFNTIGTIYKALKAP